MTVNMNKKDSSLAVVCKGTYYTSTYNVSEAYQFE